MATKRDLIDAQTFSNRRLLTAFVAGAPGGKELEPAKPLRAVVAGIAIATLIVIGSIFYGMLRPGLPAGWETNTLILASDTGARYITREGQLYPVTNATSARLLIPAESYTVVTTTSDQLADIPVGPTIGILGAPDDVPNADALVATGWTACLADDGGVLVSLPGEATPSSPDQAVVVVAEGTIHVISGGYRYRVDEASTEPVLRAVGLAGVTPIEVGTRWLNLFTEGQRLAPLTIAGAGSPVEGTSVRVGSAVEDSASGDFFVVTEGGDLAPLTLLGYQLYLLNGSRVSEAAEVVSAAELTSFGNSSLDQVDPEWPTEAFSPERETSTPCARLQHDAEGDAVTSLSMSPRPVAQGGLEIGVHAGALVAASGRGPNALSEAVVVDDAGTAYALPGATEETLAQLGYGLHDLSAVPTAWMQYFSSGPELTAEAAGSSPTLAVDALSSASCEPGEVVWSQEPSLPLELLQGPAVANLATGVGVTVAVVDSGIDAQNPHLSDVVVGGINLVDDDTDPNGLTDVAGHGTQVAGIIAARALSQSALVGIAPDVSVLSVRVFRDLSDKSIEAGWGPTAAKVASGIVWAADHGAHIINVSLSVGQDTRVLREAVEYASAAGSLVVASGGNLSTAVDDGYSVRYPAAYSTVLGVSAVDLSGDASAASIHGAHVDVAAPGEYVLTTAPGGGDCTYATDEASSSFATAFASGAAALVAERFPEDTPAGWAYRLEATAARSAADTRTDGTGWGVIQPLDALTAVLGSDARGPKNPVTGEAGNVVAATQAALHPVPSSDPLVGAREVLMLAGIVTATLAAGLGLRSAMRGRTPVDAVESGPGLLDAHRDRTTAGVPPAHPRA